MKENSIREDIERLKLCSTNQCNICGRYEKEECMLERNRCEQHILSDYKKILKEAKRYKNMYVAEHQIHLVRNEQLDRKQQLVIKCNELEVENKELKEEIKSWKKYSDEQEENIIEKNNIICNLEFQNAELKNEHSCLINRIENKIDKLDYEMERAKRRNDQERANYCWDFLINFTNLLESEE